MNQLFIYAGHTMRANIEGDAQLVVESLKAEPIKHGIYPVNFAEGEAWDILTDEMERITCSTIEEADRALQGQILKMIRVATFKHPKAI